MLQHLRIEGLAIIEKLEIDFHQGLNVITGETGAGKSILIKALGILLGAKATSDSVRKGREAASITAEFELPEGHQVFVKAAELGIDVSEMGERPKHRRLLIRRRIQAKSKSQAWINDELVTSATLRSIGDELIDIFAQHETQRMLDREFHLDYVDAFLADPKIPLAYRGEYQRVQQLMTQLEELIQMLTSGSRDQDYLEYRLQELDQFAPDVEDYQQLKQSAERLRVGRSQRETLLRCQSLVDESVDGDSLTRPLRELSRILSKNSVFEDSGILKRSEEIANAIDELSYDISKQIHPDDDAEMNIEDVESRVAAYQDLFRKFGVGDAEQLVEQQLQLRTTLTALQDARGEIEQRLAELDQALEVLQVCGKKLSLARNQAAKKIESSVVAELKDLALNHAVLDVRLSLIKRTPKILPVHKIHQGLVSKAEAIAMKWSQWNGFGAEEAEFWFSANKGEQPYPIQKVASGGEVSRIMLAFKRALTVGADSCLLVFDEIDTGISGKTADLVGAKLRELSRQFQVICISHLAQVTAYADTHFVVRKSESKGRTESIIEALSPKQSIEELARLLSGDEITKHSLANARALVEKVRH